MTIKTVDVPKTLRGPKGQTLKWLKKATFVDSPPRPRLSPPSGEALRSVLDMSDDELAEALRRLCSRMATSPSVRGRPTP